MTIIPPPNNVYTLDIHFRGICSHFYDNVLPGVPHRVVLPDATAIRPGLLTGPDTLVKKSKDPMDWLMYVLLPHFAMVQCATAPSLNVDGILLDGLIFTSARLVVSNVIETTVTYPPPEELPPPSNPDITYLPFEDVPALHSFVSHYAYSNDVVLGGRASAYFDLYGGQVFAFQDGESKRVAARVMTAGPPQLRITPLMIKDMPLPTTIIPLTSDPQTRHAEMIIANAAMSCIEAEYDFLLHYLTSTAGIPRALKQTLPGMHGGGLDMEEVLTVIKELLTGKFPLPIPGPIEDIDLQASCSDSRYP